MSAIDTTGHHDARDTARAPGTFGRLVRDGWALVFGEVRHTRLRPTRHAFRYPAFHLRVPVDRLPSEGCGSVLFGVNRPGLLSFHEADHGAGGPALAFIRGLLAEAGVRADGAVWLHTFPRVLGYTFKPVSFWHCHDAEGRLAAVVAEVNNTFGERHCYLLAHPDGTPLRAGEELRAHKVFHVSPFCAVEGAYRFRFLSNGRRSVARIDLDDAHGPLLVTSLSGELHPLHAQAALRALLLHPAFTVMVILRIHWHALKLWLKRVPFHRKPAPPEGFVTRASK